MRHINMKKENAVSPVVGVMLMLVVTIIVAAVVGSFAGDIGGEEQQAPNVKFDVTYKAQITDADKTNSIPDYSGSCPKNNGFMFKLINGDSIELSKIKLVLTSGGQSLTITTDLPRNTDGTVSAVDNNVLNNFIATETKYGYFAVPNGMDEVISAGESFTVLADGYYDNSEDAAAIKKGKFLLWQPDGAGKFTVQTLSQVKYTIFDTVSGKQIQTGTVNIK